MAGQITYDIEVELDVPPEINLTSVTVQITIEPADASALIYGYMPDGNLGCFEVQGGEKVCDLPIKNGKIWVKYLRGLRSFRVATLRFQDPL